MYINATTKYPRVPILGVYQNGFGKRICMTHRERKYVTIAGWNFLLWHILISSGMDISQCHVNTFAEANTFQPKLLKHILDAIVLTAKVAR
jgi:hypothetical protein